MKTSKNELRSGRERTLAESTIKRMQWLCGEYERIKLKQHARFCFVTEFYNFHNIKRQNFIKFYNRYKESGNKMALLPQKRGPRYKTRRTLGFIEQKVVELRVRGLNRFEIVHDLKPVLHESTPCPATVYNICKRYGVNRLTAKMQEKKRKIIKERAGQLGHIDCHYLPKGIIENDDNRYYLVGLIDNKTAAAWVEVTTDITSLSVMFAAMKMLNLFKLEFEVNFEEIITDNGAEFGGGVKERENLQHNPFARMLIELNIKHRFTKPYRPQTNGKIERLWRTIENDLLHEMVFDSLDHLRNEVFEYMTYYNYARPHQSIGGKTPSHMLNKNIS